MKYSVGTTAVMCFSGGSGGMELDTIKLADLLSDSCRIVLFCKEGSTIHELYEGRGGDYVCEPVRFRSRKFSLSMLRKVKSAIRKYQVRNVIFFGASELKTLYFSFLGFELNVIVRHGTTKSTPKRGYIHRLVYSCVDHHVALSWHLLDNVKSIVPVNEGVDFRIITSSFDSDNVNRSVRKDGEQGVLRIIHVGRVAPGKGQIEAVLSCHGLVKSGLRIRLDLLGGFQDRKYVNHLKSVIKKCGMGNDVVLHGHVENVGDYMKSADIFLFPSYGEGMSNAMIEALHYGLICLCYSNTVFPEFGKMGFYIVLAKDRDPSDLAEKLSGIAHNISEEKRKSERNALLALKYFSREREKDEWLKILK